MAILHGEVTKFGRTEHWVHTVGSHVLVTQRGTAIAAGVVGNDDTFEIELPTGIRGEIEVSVASQGAAPTLVEADGNDLMVTVIFNPGGAYY